MAETKNAQAQSSTKGLDAGKKAEAKVPAGQTQGSNDMIYSDCVTPEFCQKVKKIADKIGVNPNDLMACMHFETGGAFSAGKYYTKKGKEKPAIGLIQFTQAAIDDLNGRGKKLEPKKAVTREELAAMSEIDQLDYVEKFFMIQKIYNKSTFRDVSDLYMAILCPNGVGQESTYPLYSSGTIAYDQNKGLDTDKNGVITKEEAASKPINSLKNGLQQLEDRNAPDIGSGTIKLQNDPTLPMRSGAGKGFQVIGKIPNGALFTYIKENNGWLRIRYNGKMGWISKQYTLLDSATNAAMPTSTSLAVADNTATPAAQPNTTVSQDTASAPAANTVVEKSQESASPVPKPADEEKKGVASSDNYIETSNDNINKIQKAHPNGITISLYGTTDDDVDEFQQKGYTTKYWTDKNGKPQNNKGNNREFENVAKAGASASNSLTASLNMGTAIKANAHSSATSIINNVYSELHNAYKASKPDTAKDEPEHLKIKNLSLYYHGLQNALKFPRGSLEKTAVGEFVSGIKNSLRSDVHVQLYACNTAGKDDGFAHEMATELGDDARVYGHLNASHTTENANARYFKGDGTAVDMFDALMPESWIKAEAVRVWGTNYSADAYKALEADLKEYYKAVCGMQTNGWYSKQRQDFENNVADYPTVYKGSKLNGMGRYMFHDTDNAAKLLQTGWRHWAKNNNAQKTKLAANGKLADTFENINATAAAPAQSDAPKSAEQSPKSAPPVSKPAEKAPVAPEAAPKIAEVLSTTKAAEAVKWYTDKKFTPDLIQRIQAVVGIANPSTTMTPSAVQAVAAWQKLKECTDVDGEFGNGSAAKTNDAQLKADIAKLIPPKQQKTSAGTLRTSKYLEGVSGFNTDLWRLAPKVRAAVPQLINNLDKTYGMKFKLFQGIRTPAHSNQLKAVGEGKAASGWNSFHNYGMAVDMVLDYQGVHPYQNTGIINGKKAETYWENLKTEGKKLGLNTISIEQCHLQAAPDRQPKTYPAGNTIFSQYRNAPKDKDPLDYVWENMGLN